MKTVLFSKLAIFALLLGLFFTACEKDPIDPVDDDDDVITDLKFIGSESCKTCHSDKYNTWIKSGHPYKFSVITDGIAPEYPAEVVNFMDTWMANLGNGSHTWADVAGVIGGYGWKARFVGQDGYIIGTAGSEYSPAYGHNQINFFGGENHGWVNYNADNPDKLYNYSCFKCHTTGGTEDGTWLEGVDGLGNFAEQGIGCESCHGPGSLHAEDPSTENIDRVYEFAHSDNADGGLVINGTVQTPNEAGNDVNFLCGTCHNRNYDNVIEVSGGYIKHHEQWEEIVSGGHQTLDCSSCHNPHERVIWDGQGITSNCTDCHTVAETNHTASANCVDCHMPYAAKSGTARGESGYEGDIRSHLMKIVVSDESMFTADGSAVRDDSERPAALSVAFSCLGCHNRDSNDNIPDKTLEQAIQGAGSMHGAKGIAHK